MLDRAEIRSTFVRTFIPIGGKRETLELSLTLFYSLFRHPQVGGGTPEIDPTLSARSLLG